MYHASPFGDRKAGMNRTSKSRGDNPAKVVWGWGPLLITTYVWLVSH